MRVSILWDCPNRKKDPDNIAFAKKFILDGLREALVLENDGWNNIVSFEDHFATTGVVPNITVTLSEI